MIFHILYTLLSVFLYVALFRENPHESCGGEYLLLYRYIYPFFLLPLGIMLVLRWARESVKVLMLYTLLMAIPLSLVLHGICDHTSYAYLKFFAVVQAVYYLPLLMVKVYKQLTFSHVMGLFLFIAAYLYLLIWGPSLMYQW